MIPEIEQEYICDLKCVSPKIDLHISRIRTPEAASFFHKRLQQLASAAEQKVLSLKNDKSLVINEVGVIN